jgi:hypothetical protein
MSHRLLKISGAGKTGINERLVEIGYLKSYTDFSSRISNEG